MKRTPEEFGGGRRTPAYTTVGITRLLCSVAGCGRRAWASWAACADDNIYRPLCPEHDVDLNTLALRWFGDPDADAKIAAYRAQVEADIHAALEDPS